MISDIRQMPDGSDVECDLCIIGGGAAGITIALEYANTPVNVLLLESGGLEFEEATQKLYQGRNVGLPYHDLEAARLRFLGGTTNHWAGWSRPLDRHDFDQRDWMPLSGWPIAYDDFARYLARAARYCEIPYTDYSAATWLKKTAPDVPANAMEPLKPYFRPAVFHFSPPTRFGERYLDDLKKAGNVRVLLHANVTSIDTNRNEQVVDGLSVASLEGKKINVRPRVVILATGGIENARVLLASRKTHRNGLGNAKGLVGRYFADHIELASGYILAPEHARLFSKFTGNTDPVHFAIDVTKEAQQTHKLNNMDITLHEVSNFAETSEGFGALRRIKRALAQGKWPDNLLSDAGKAIMDIDEIISLALSKGDDANKGIFLMYNRCEVVPNRDSTVTLDDAVDRLGVPRLKLDWRLTEQDYMSIRKTHELIGQTLGASGLGRVKVELRTPFEGWPSVLQGGYHHLGTTRMSSSDGTGVVDTDCRVFGTQNLYVAGSSVFPTFGKANPTLNLLALALRLSDHLKSKMG